MTRHHDFVVSGKDAVTKDFAICADTKKGSLNAGQAKGLVG